MQNITVVVGHDSTHLELVDNSKRKLWLFATEDMDSTALHHFSNSSGVDTGRAYSV